MRIASIEAVQVRVPLEVPYVFGRGVMTAFDSVIVRIDTDEGLTGYGESIPLFKSATSDPAAVSRAINGPVRDRLVGADPRAIEAIVEDVLAIAGGNVDIVAGVDPALWDILGKLLDVPVYQLLGGPCQEDIPVDFTIGGGTPEEMAEAARTAITAGFGGVVVKANAASPEIDVDRVRRVRAAIPAASTVRIDCNGAYDREGARDFIRQIVDCDIELVEQPVAADDLEGLAACRGLGVPISIDETLLTPRDALRAVEAGACDLMNIKVPRVGGLLLAKRMAAIAAAAGLPVIVGGRTALELSRYTSRHLAASTPGSVGRQHEGPGPASQALSDDVVERRTRQQDGFVTVEKTPGMGYEVDWGKVEKYRVTV